jgi:hypothetical protein
MNFIKRGFNFPFIEGKNAGSTVKGQLKIIEKHPMYIVVETTLSSDAVKFEPLFKEWNSFDQEVIKAENIRGQASIFLNFKGPFDLYEEKILKEKFYVRVKMKITDGALLNVKPFKEITKSLRGSGAKLLISKKKINEFEKRLFNLQFKTFENEFYIKNGIITIPSMTISSNALDVNVEGAHSFDNKIDYSFDFRFRQIKGNQQSKYGDIIDDETGFRIFLKMFGTIDNPKFEWDKQAQKAQRKEKREQGKEGFKSALKTGFGINKNDTTIQELKEEKPLEEKVIMDFGNDTLQDEFDPGKKEKKKSKLKQKMEQWKKENEEEKSEEEFEFE